MQWISIFWLLASSAIVASSASDGRREKRHLSLLTRLLSNGMGRTREKCTKTNHLTHHRPLEEYGIVVHPDRQHFIVETETSRFKGSKRRKPHHDNDFFNSLRQFLTSDFFQQISTAFGSIIRNLVTDETNKQNGADTSLYVSDLINEESNKQNAADVSLYVPDHKSVVTIVPENPLSINKLVYNNPEAFAMPAVVDFMKPIITMPRKYSYEQIRGEAVQTFSLDNNSDVKVTETSGRLPRPAYVEDRIKDMVLGVPSHAHQQYLSNAIKKYESKFKPNMEFVQQNGVVDEKLPSNDIFMYDGEPIVVLEDASKIKRTILNEDNEIDNIEERNDIDKPRGDIDS